MKNLFLIAVAVFLFTACKTNSSEDNNKESSGSVISDAIDAVTPSDGLKSAIYETEMDMPGGMGKANSKVIFDDHGKKTLTQITTAMSFGGKTMSTIATTLLVDGYAYSWSNVGKTGTKIKIDDSKIDPKNLDVSKLTDEMKAKLKFKDEGQETIDGRVCKVGSYSIEQMNGKVWIWKQIPVKMQMSIGGNVITSNLKNIEENPSIPAGTFDVPSTIEFKEMSMQNAAPAVN